MLRHYAFRADGVDGDTGDGEHIRGLANGLAEFAQVGCVGVGPLRSGAETQSRESSMENQMRFLRPGTAAR